MSMQNACQHGEKVGSEPIAQPFFETCMMRWHARLEPQNQPRLPVLFAAII